MVWAKVWSIDPRSGEFLYFIDEDVRIVDPSRVWTVGARVCDGPEPFIPSLEYSIEPLVQGVSFGEPDFVEIDQTNDINLLSLDRKCQNESLTHPITVLETCLPSLPDNGRMMLSVFSWMVGSTPKDTVYLFGMFRGRNPSRQVVGALMPSDLFRAIVWKESRWTQFRPDGLPTKNPVTDDWGLCQINGAPQLLKWDWRANLRRGIEILDEKFLYAKRYLSSKGMYTEEMLQREATQRYNGGRYHSWDGSKWVADPPNSYVAEVFQILAERPW